MNFKSGQITVLVMLLSLLALAVALSVASRSLSDLKQVAYVDSGTRALAAAEAGLQFALANATSADGNCNTALPRPITGLSLNGLAAGGLTYIYCVGGENTVTISNVAKDDVAELDLSLANPNFKSIDVSWKGDASVEIVVIDNDGVVRRFPYNAKTLDGHTGNGFALAQDGSECGACGIPGATFDSCTGLGEILYKRDKTNNASYAQLIRVKPIYQGTNINFCARAANSTPVSFGLTHNRIIVTAKMADGTQRRIQADKSPASMPAIFDNVIYSGGNIIK